MAHLRKKKNHYYAEFYDRDRRPKRKWVALQTKDKTVARQRLARFEREFAMGMRDPWEDTLPQKGVTADKALDMFLQSRRDKGCRKTTVDNYDNMLRPFTDRLPAGTLIDQVEPRHIRDYLARDKIQQDPEAEPEPLSPTTRHTYWRQLRTFFRWAVKEELIKSSPIDEVPEPHLPKKEAEFLMPKQVENLITCIRSEAVVNADQVQDGEVLWIIDVIRFAVYTGLRLGEICDLRWRAVHQESGFLTVRDTEDFQTKSGHEGRVPIVPQAQEILGRLQEQRTSEDPDEHVFKGVNGRPLYPNYVSGRFRHYRKKAKLPDSISFHSLRHTCASWLVMKGTPLRTVQAMLRHSSFEVTQRYAHLAPDSFKSQIEKAFADL